MPVQKKKQSKVSKVLSFFNPRNLKGGMALFALVFALGGAGYFVYSSFALTPGTAAPQYKGKSPVAIYYYGPNDIVSSHGNTSQWHDSVLSSKSAANLTWKLTAQNGDFASVYASTTKTDPAQYSGYTAVTCVYARGSALQSTYDNISVYAFGGTNPPNVRSDNISSSYKEYCSGGNIIRPASEGNFSPGAVAVPDSRSISTVVVGHITVYVY